jgi:hypothetical protein
MADHDILVLKNLKKSYRQPDGSELRILDIPAYRIAFGGHQPPHLRQSADRRLRPLADARA